MSCSSVVEAQASPNANPFQQTETMICMHPNVYNAAAKGEIQFFKGIQDSLDLLLTPNKNTILHVYITSLNNMEPGSKTGFVEAILDICPPLVRQCNIKGETPLHIAARHQHAAIVKFLIDRVKTEQKDVEVQSQVDPSKEMLRMMNKWKDTALHEAVRYNHLNVLKILLTEDPDFVYPPNEAGETLLYMAVERSFRDVAFEILETCDSAAYTGPLGRTALHVAALRDDAGMIDAILEKIGGLSKQVDEDGFTPLHLAAGLGNLSASQTLLDFDREAAYMKDKEGKTALHIAAYKGYPDIVRAIVLRCPDCCELVDKRGWNALHFSVSGANMEGSCKQHEETTRIIVENSSFKNLLNEKDFDGNTPFLLHSKTASKFLRGIAQPMLDTMAFNNQNLNAADILKTNKEAPNRKRSYIWAITFGDISRRVSFGVDNNGKSGDISSARWEKAAEAHLVVAALITTVTFAAGIAMPGGFMGGDDRFPGSAVLARSSAFRAFVITDSISMVLSSWAVFTHMLLPLTLSNSSFFSRFRKYLQRWAFNFILLALVAMVLAFAAGTYAVLSHHSFRLAVTTSVIGLSFLPFFLALYTGYRWVFEQWLRKSHTKSEEKHDNKHTGKGTEAPGKKTEALHGHVTGFA